MTLEAFVSLLLAQCLSLALIYLFVSLSLPLAIQQFMKRMVLSKRTGKLSKRR